MKELEAVQKHCIQTIITLDWYSDAMEKSGIRSEYNTELLYYTAQLMFHELCEDKPSLSLIKALIEKETIERNKLKLVYADIMRIAKNHAKENGLINDMFSPN